MSQVTTEPASPERPRASRRLDKLFKVLVVGGAVIAAAYATAIHGSTGTADRGSDDGGSPGW